MSFIHDDFMLSSDEARELYHGFAERLPIIDYHCHLSPQQIAENIQFQDITQLWIFDGSGGDHYKWRALRANGVSEDYITGKKSAWEKFEKWAETVPYTMRNPLYHWTHLELKRVFGIDKLLNPSSARDIFEECNEKLRLEEYRGRALIRKFNVEVICTTDDPADNLKWHSMLKEQGFGTKVLPTWRPDKAMAVEDPKSYCAYLDRLSEVSGIEISSYSRLCEALKKRHDFFGSLGCRLSDHGTDKFYSEKYSSEGIENIFCKLRRGKDLTCDETEKFKSAFMFDQAVMDAESGWVQQFHVGPLRNNNSKMFSACGPDSGYDSINDKALAEEGNRFFDSLERCNSLAKTILYCLNPKDNEVMTTMAYNFNDGLTPGKMQFGSGWWFLDQEKGMRNQLDTISNLGLLSRFVGMLTDSRSFISYPRHEYFRRILCDVLGRDLDTGRLPEEELPFIEKMVGDICYNNAKTYFGF